MLFQRPSPLKNIALFKCLYFINDCTKLFWLCLVELDSWCQLVGVINNSNSLSFSTAGPWNLKLDAS